MRMAHRSASGLAPSLGQVARATGWNKATLSLMERGLRPPPPALVVWYCGRYGGGDLEAGRLLVWLAREGK